MPDDAAGPVTTESATIRRVTFTVQGTTLVGHHYRAGGGACAAARPVVVMAIGFGALQSMALPPFARRVAEAGMDVLTFDYRHWGESGGTPRELLVVRRQLEDLRAAIAAARRLPGIDPDRVALWGTSFGGGHVLTVAAGDPRLKAVVAQAPHVSGPATVAAIPPRHLPGLLAAATADVWRALRRKTPRYVPVVAPQNELAAITQAGAHEGYLRLVPTGVYWPNRVAARLSLGLPLYNPAWAGRHSRVPTFVAVGARDTLTPPGPARRLARRLGAVLEEYEADHFGVYETGPAFEPLLADELTFLRRHLVAAG